ncbi:uncharacterized protein LOC133296408 [Gastrolobium bilobum]|uniref:uncharacterized protein LOC133296408 n=1 Tax=Gastrolobium bilobum TaxID=150636 RepID=UPI002AB0FE37|nr:uncharacterized protein LOC133296408 [Gastrolobium bilobum]
MWKCQNLFCDSNFGDSDNIFTFYIEPECSKLGLGFETLDYAKGSGKNSQNKSRSCRKDTSYRYNNMSQFNSNDHVPHLGGVVHSSGGRYLPHQTSGPAWCEICEVTLNSHKIMKVHKNGKRHRGLLKLHEESKKNLFSNGQQREQMSNSQMNSVVQPKLVLKSEKLGCLVENVSSEATAAKHKSYLGKDIGKPSDNFGAQGHGFKRKSAGAAGATGGKYMKTNNGIRKPMDSSKLAAKALSSYVESVVQVPARVRDNFGAQSHGLKRKSAGATGGKYMKTNNGIRKPMDSSKLAAKALSSYVESVVQVPARVRDKYLKTNTLIRKPMDSSNLGVNALSDHAGPIVQVPAVALPSGAVASQIKAPTPVVGSSFELQIQHVSASETQVSEGKKHQQIQNPTLETNVQPQSISVELNALAGSNIRTQTEDVSYDSTAIAVAPPKEPMASPVLASEPVVGSSFESHTETEPQGSEAITHYESQNPTDKSNNQLLSSVLMEFDGASGSGFNTQTADGSSKAEEKMDVLTPKFGLTQLSQETVCLTCGDEGFPELLDFCETCQVSAVHSKFLSSYLTEDAPTSNAFWTFFNFCIISIKGGRIIVDDSKEYEMYCLDGPVDYNGEVTWFCEDCEAKVVDTSSHDQSKARIEVTNCMKKVRKNKQQQNANSTEGHVIVAEPQPIADPVWRGSLYFCDQSIDTFSGVLAHLSNLARRQVQEEARLLPEVLRVDLLDRSEVWPNYFKESGPNEESIALYFFPENER